MRIRQGVGAPDLRSAAKAKEAFTLKAILTVHHVIFCQRQRGLVCGLWFVVCRCHFVILSLLSALLPFLPFLPFDGGQY